MDGDIVFYIHGDTIEYGGELFSAGELTADILNLSLEDYQRIQKNVRHMKNLTEQYERTQDREFWRKLNYQFMALRKRMMEFRVFQILLRDDSKFLNEAQQYTEFRTLLPEEDLDYEDFSADQWVDMAEQAETTGQIPVPLLIFPGGRKTKWLYYRKQMNRYERYLGDVACFNPTIHNFIHFLLSKLEHNSPENYAASLYQLYNDERLVEKLIVNPRSLEQPFYQKYDHCVVSYVPRELPDKRFAICQEHTTDSLQMLLKADYMTALNAGHNIRQCVVCKKYFLVKGGAHVLYCEGACPHAPQYTCRQFETYEVQKELARDVPKIQAKLTAFERIRKDQKRDIITAEEARRLKDTVRDMLFDALNEADVSNENFERSISSERLYPYCGVTRKTKPRGRPRKGGGDA